MARFFQTTRPELVDNFLYQPPWELAVSVMQKKEADIENQINTMEVLKNLPVDYAEVDRENAMRIKDDLSNRIDSLTQDFQKNLLNPDNKLALRNLQREVQRSYEFGDLNKISKNAQRFRDWETQLQQLNPEERNVYRNQMLRNYTESNPGGALNNLFEADQMYNTRNLLSEFADYASKNIKDDSIAKAFDKVDGKYIVTREALENGVTRDKINSAFRGWVESQQDLPGYFKNREKYFNESYFNNDGSLAFDKENTTLNNVMNATNSLSWNKSQDKQSLKADPYALEDQKFSHDMSKMREQFRNQVSLAKLSASLSGNKTDESDNIYPGEKVTKNLNKLVTTFQQQKSTLVNNIRKSLAASNTYGLNLPGYQVMSDDQILNTIKANKQLYPDLYNQVVSVDNQLNQARSASWLEYSGVIGDKKVEALRKNISNMINATTKFYLGDSDNDNVSSESTNLNSFIRSLGTESKKKIELLKDSYVPVHMGTNKNSDDFIKGTVRVEDTESGSFQDLPIFIRMNEVSSNYDPVVMEHGNQTYNSIK